MTIDEQKDICKELLLKVKVSDYWACCAGGAPRNWLHGREANDLDIYIRHPKWCNVEWSYTSFCTLIGAKVLNVWRDYGGIEGVSRVIAAEYKGLPVSFVFLDEKVWRLPAFAIRSFDWSICDAIAYVAEPDGEMKIEPCEGLRYSMETKRCILNGRLTEYQRAKSLGARLAKFQREYQEYEYYTVKTVAKVIGTKYNIGATGAGNNYTHDMIREFRLLCDPQTGEVKHVELWRDDAAGKPRGMSEREGYSEYSKKVIFDCAVAGAVEEADYVWPQEMPMLLDADAAWEECKDLIVYNRWGHR